jgi:hypothetical protein
MDGGGAAPSPILIESLAHALVEACSRHPEFAACGWRLAVNPRISFALREPLEKRLPCVSVVHYAQIPMGTHVINLETIDVPRPDTQFPEPSGPPDPLVRDAARGPATLGLDGLPSQEAGSRINELRPLPPDEDNPAFDWNW